MMRQAMVLSLVAMVASAAWAGPGFDDWFWGEPIATLSQDTTDIPPEDLVVGQGAMLYARIPSSVLSSWAQHPEWDYGLAVIPQPPDYTGGTSLATYLHSQDWARPRLRVDGAWQVADAMARIHYVHSDFMQTPHYYPPTDSPEEFRLLDGRNVVLIDWPGPFPASQPGDAFTLRWGAPGGATEGVAFDVYVTPALWDESYITYEYFAAGGRREFPGDLNGDLFVDDEDLNILLANWGFVGGYAMALAGAEDVLMTPPKCNVADINNDCCVDDRDLSLLLSVWGMDYYEPIPEPVSLALLALGALALRRR